MSMSRTRRDLVFIAAISVVVAGLSLLAWSLARLSPEETVVHIGDGLAPPGAAAEVAAALSRAEAAGSSEPEPDADLADGGEEGEEIEAPPGSRDPLVARAAALRREGRLYEAIGVLEDARVAGDETAERLSALGSLLLGAGRTARAVDVLRRAVALDPRNARAQYNLGVGHSALGDDEAAIGAYLRTLELRPAHSRALFNLGMCYLRGGELERAEAAFQQVTEVDRTGRAAKAYFQLGYVRVRLDRYEQATRAYRDAIRIRPDYAEARNNLALALEDQGDVAGAIHELEKGLRLAAGVPSLAFNLGRLYAARDRLEDAVRAFDRAIAADPAMRKAHVARAEALLRLGRKEQAAEAYERALELKPGDAELRIELAGLYRELDQLELAERHLEQVVVDRPRLASGWNTLGIVRAQQGRDEQALRCYDRAIELDDEGAAAWYNRALALERLERIEEMPAALREVLERAPDHLAARERLARVWLMLEQPERARAEASKLVRLAGDDVPMLFAGAVLLSRGGDPEAAIPVWLRILELEPGHALARLNLGVAYTKTGRDAEAAEAYERYLELRPDDERARGYLARARARL